MEASLRFYPLSSLVDFDIIIVDKTSIIRKMQKKFENIRNPPVIWRVLPFQSFSALKEVQGYFEFGARLLERAAFIIISIRPLITF